MVRALRPEERSSPPVAKGFDEIIAGARALAPRIEECRPEIERSRRLPARLVEELRGCGVFRAAMPAEWNGPALTSMQQVALVEQLSMADASVGWCAMIGMDSGIYAGYLSPDSARQVFPRLDMITAGWVPPAGRAREVDGGYLV